MNMYIYAFPTTLCEMLKGEIQPQDDVNVWSWYLTTYIHTQQLLKKEPGKETI